MTRRKNTSELKRQRRTWNARYCKTMPADELIRLRRALGLPASGPTREMHQQWNRIEALIEQRDQLTKEH